jgi:hypothetical protein
VYIDADELDQERETVTISEVIGIINDIEGVRYIDHLWFEDDQGTKVESISYDPSLQFVPYLQPPESEEGIGVRLFKNEREYRISLTQIRRGLDRHKSQFQALRRTEQEFTEVSKPPKGASRNLGEYYSIQEHFPDNYGINRFGVPESESPRRLAQARQLKAYLLFFEQIMANFLGNLQEISRSFSLDEQLQQSYFYQVLCNKNVPNVEGLYREDLAWVDENVAQILDQYDNFGDRRNRLLDYLLAIYGEKLTQHSLRRFNYYYTNRELEHEVIRNKINLLKLIGDLI